MFVPKVRDSSMPMPKGLSRCRNFENAFCCDCSVHAVKKIGHSTSGFRKFFWILILIISSVGCLLQIIEFLSFYLNYSVVINLETNKAKSLEFPAVTLCNTNSIRKEFQSCVEKKLSYDDCINLRQKEERHVDELKNSTALCSGTLKGNFTEKNNRPWLDAVTLDYITRLKYGHQADDFIKSCTFNGKLCSSADFKISLSYNYGNCFTYMPSKEQVHLLFPGPSSGLELEIDLETSKYATFTDNIGVKMQLHDPRLRHNIDEENIVVSSGTKSYVAVTKTIFSRLSSPYKDRCRDYNDADSQVNCVDICLHNIISTGCFCSLRIDLNDSFPLCDLRDPIVLCCLTENYSDEDCDCPLPCNENVYNIQTSSAVWPVKVQDNDEIIDCINASEISHNSKCKKIRETRLILKIFWNTFEYIVYKQNPEFQKSEVFSQIGGLMSLWLGISIIAVFEALENIILFCKGT